MRDALRATLLDLGVPVIEMFPVGHGLRNEPVILGATAVIEAGETSASLRVHASDADRGSLACSG